MSVVYITQSEVNLVSWSEYKKPPYTSEEYTTAYNNGVNLVAAIENAYSNGATKIILEKGKYPWVIVNTNQNYQTGLNPHAILNGFENLEIDFGGSVFFMLFDSVNRSPYHTGGSLPPHMIGGCIFAIQNTTNFTIKNIELRGCQYNRSWVTGEQDTEQTYGIVHSINNINTKLDIVAHGFRGDAVTGSWDKNTHLTSLNTWEKGGVDVNTGAINQDEKSYRTPKISLDWGRILRGSVQIMSGGYLRKAEFRNVFLRVFFYDKNNVLIGSEFTEQCTRIVLPPKADSLIFVAYDDERTDLTISYGSPLALVTGGSEDLTITGEIYNNHRGGLSNLCNDGKVIDAYIHDIGGTKFGFPHYADSTRYAVNNEDVYASKLTLQNVRIANCIHGVLCNANQLVATNVSIDNIQFYAWAVYNSRSVVIDGGTLKNCAIALNTQYNGVGQQHLSFTNVSLQGRGSNLLINAKKGHFINISNCTGSLNMLVIKNNGGVVSFCNNTLLSIPIDYVESVVLEGLTNITGNHIKMLDASGNKAWQCISLNADNSYGNSLVFSPGKHYKVLDDTKGFSGVDLTVGNNGRWELLPKESFAETEGVQEVLFKDSSMALAHYVSCNNGISPDLNLVFKNCKLKLSSGATNNSMLDFAGSVLGNMSIMFDNCYFELELNGENRIVNIRDIEKMDSANISFVNCTFMSKLSKNLRHVRTNTISDKLTTLEVGSRYMNIVRVPSV